MDHRRATASIQPFALAAALWACCMRPAAAESVCAPTGEPGIERCVNGLPVAGLSAIFEPQQASNWCWAASIAMILRRYGVAVPQEQVVRTLFGLLANERASVQAMGALLNRRWDDADGHTLVASAQPLASWRRTFGLAAPEVLEDLAKGRPLLAGARQHAVVVVQAVYERRVDGKPLTAVGVRLLRVLVLDPASRDWLRTLQPDERAPEFLARVAVKLRPATTRQEARAPDATDSASL